MAIEIVDSLIGFLTVILLLSVLVTALAQATQSLLRLRGRNVQRGLEMLFRQAMIASQDDANEKPVGLLVVHGMGRQKAGATRDSVVRGLRKAYPEARFEARGAQGDMVLGGRRIRIYEVYWAPVLMGKSIHGSFSLELIYQFVWFPVLNHQVTGSNHNKDYDDQFVLNWRRKLLRLAVLVGTVYNAIKLPLGWAEKLINRALKRDPGREIAPAAAFDNLLADSIGDVFNYVKAYVGAPAAPVPGAPDEIYKIFHKELKLAARECSEIQVLAHSMGTLVVHHALTRYSSTTRKHLALTKAEIGPDRPYFSWLYTIGTPLEKIRFFWPRIIDLKKMDEGDFEWYNFRSPLDIVAGEMRHLGENRANKVEDQVVRGAGGLITAHRGYRSHPTFLGIFGPKLTGHPTDIRPLVTWGWLLKARNVLESVLAGLVIAVLFGIGAAGVFAMGYYITLAVLLVADEGQHLTELSSRLIASLVGGVLAYFSLFSAPLVAREGAEEIHKYYRQTVLDPADAAGDEAS